ncbi:2-phospho-L-lactate guanylyltransferase [Nocardia transvalensis]|uniref:Phosphoenolpyruvate guanylyltransferase n=1 Tax=Nocardia transvalensis TaxID=37333 RepID=A0A7W9UGG7_9NOCA|nr:2-phospho-L-lactate guanylyltransferase [Nocardia transvalensis]MBB5911670.1 2-phospho-L-lactate guanylyltransferase [Nocardia transvalensis]
MRQDPVHAVIAVKHLDRAKSRLADRLPPGDRSRLVLAMLSDTVTAAVAAGLSSVTVVTPDPEVAATVRGLGATVHPDPATGDAPRAADARNGRIDSTRPGTAPDSGLNAALIAGAAAVRELHGGVDLLALQADLPALRPEELSDMLATAPAGRAIVADHAGRGTAALLVRDAASPLEPLFGGESARRHIDSGAKDLAGDWPGLRLDVDTEADLDRAVALGVGPATAEILRTIGWPTPVHRDLIRKYAANHMCAG